MSRTIGVSLTTNEKLNLADLLKCKDEDLGKVLKASFTNQKHSRHFRDLSIFSESGDSVPNPESEAKGLSDAEIKNALGVKGTNLIKKIREKGLHYTANVELYLTQFLQEWNGDPYKARELILTVRDYTEKEFLVRELVNRYI